MIGAGEVTGLGEHVEREHVGEPAVGRRVVEAAGVGHEGANHAVCAVELGGVTKEGVEVLGRLHCRTGRRVDLHHIVDDLHLDPVPGAEALVGRLQGELVAPVGQTLVAMVEALE